MSPRLCTGAGRKTPFLARVSLFHLLGRETLKQASRERLPGVAKVRSGWVPHHGDAGQWRVIVANVQQLMADGWIAQALATGWSKHDVLGIGAPRGDRNGAYRHGGETKEAFARAAPLDGLCVPWPMRRPRDSSTGLARGPRAIAEDLPRKIATLQQAIAVVSCPKKTKRSRGVMSVTGTANWRRLQGGRLFVPTRDYSEIASSAVFENKSTCLLENVRA